MIDDDPPLRQFLACGLAAHNFEVVTASHGIDALMQFHAHAGNFGAVLTDIDMPNMGGFALVRNLRELNYHGRVLIMSGHLTVSICRAYQELKVSGFLSKPFAISAAVALLRNSQGDIPR